MNVENIDRKKEESVCVDEHSGNVVNCHTVNATQTDHVATKWKHDKKCQSERINAPLNLPHRGGGNTKTPPLIDYNHNEYYEFDDASSHDSYENDDDEEEVIRKIYAKGRMFDKIFKNKENVDADDIIIENDDVTTSKKKYVRAKRCRNWTFTHFDLDDREWLNHSNIRYFKYGEEICPDTGKDHLQGWLQLENCKELMWLKKNLNKNAHWEMCRGSCTQNEDYVSKDGKVYTKGSFKKERERTDLCKVIEDIKSNKYDKYDASYIMYGKNIDKLINDKKDEDAFNDAKADFDEEFKELNSEQKKWFDRLTNQNKREILWISDVGEKSGNLGKSFFADYLAYYHNGCLFNNGSSKDIAFIYKGEPYVMFDFSRSTEDVINYGVIESLKNGNIMSGKYESKLKRFKKPKIICFSNFIPEIEKLSIDRWNLMLYKDRIFHGEFKDSKYTRCYNANTIKSNTIVIDINNLNFSTFDIKSSHEERKKINKKKVFEEIKN